MSPDDELGNKQELGGKALAAIKLSEKKKELFREDLAELYSEVHTKSGWHGVALKLQEQLPS